MKKKIDKLRALELVTSAQAGGRPGWHIAYACYDAKKLKHLNDSELTELVFEKTLKLYPFAIIEKRITRFTASGGVCMQMLLPLLPDLRTTKVQEEGDSDA